MSASDRKPHGHARKTAKALLKAVRAGDLAAIERCRAHIISFDPERFSLMTAQHVVAKERGFNSWSDLLLQEGAP